MSLATANLGQLHAEPAKKAKGALAAKTAAKLGESKPFQKLIQGLLKKNPAKAEKAATPVKKGQDALPRQEARDATKARALLGKLAEQAAPKAERPVAKPDAKPAKEKGMGLEAETKAPAKPKARREALAEEARGESGEAKIAQLLASFKPRQAEEAPRPDKEAKAEQKTEGIKEGQGRRKAEKPRLELRDYRSAKPSEDGQSASKGGEAAKDSRLDEARSTIVIDIGPRGSQGDAEAKSGSPSAPSFQSRLNESLRDVYNAEIVRQSSILLRDGDSAIMRLSLRPESLGNVKVRLEMADNNITGTIVVESEAAKDAFEADLEALAKSFVDSGFHDAKLEVSVNSGSAQDGQGRFDGRGRGQSPTMAAATGGMERQLASAEIGVGALNIVV